MMFVRVGGIMKILILILVMLVSSISYAQEQVTTTRIFSVNSYHGNHICTGPQEAGFYETLEDFIEDTSGYKFIFHGADMYTKTKNIQIEQIEHVAEQILNQIYIFKPDYIFTTDDNAFKYVAIPASRKGFKIIFSGLNKPYSDYQKEYRLDNDNFAGVNETITLTPLFTLFNNVGFVPTKYYILSEYSGNSYKSITDKFLQNVYLSILDQKKIKPTIIEIRDRRQLEKVIRDFNNITDHYVILLTIQKLYDPDTLTLHDKQGILDIIVNLNTHQLYVGENTYFCKYGLPMACSPSFYSMGQISGHILIDSILNSFTHIVRTPENIIAINIKSLKKLKLSSLYRYSGVKRIQYSEY